MQSELSTNSAIAAREMEKEMEKEKIDRAKERKNIELFFYVKEKTKK